MFDTKFAADIFVRFRLDICLHQFQVINRRTTERFDCHMIATYSGSHVKRHLQVCNAGSENGTF